MRRVTGQATTNIGTAGAGLASLPVRTLQADVLVEIKATGQPWRMNYTAQGKSVTDRFSDYILKRSTV